MAIEINTILTVTSPVFDNNDFIPAKYTCEGEDVNPTLVIGELPPNTESLALIMEDPDAAGGYIHWIMWNIPPVHRIEENSVPGIQGRNSNNESKYIGPCPPEGTHHYHFKIYALDTKLDLNSTTDKKALVNAMRGHILALGDITGLYAR
jgi:Raf kinase inhibitor-like YbhB/YbcL family protein